MTGEPQDGGTAGRALRNVHARIACWAFVRVLEQGRAPTLHIVGYIAEHQRLSDNVGEPYIGSSLRGIDLERRTAINRRGRLVELVGEPFPTGHLPHDFHMMMRRAAAEWRVPDDAVWERVELSELHEFQAENLPGNSA